MFNLTRIYPWRMNSPLSQCMCKSYAIEDWPGQKAEQDQRRNLEHSSQACLIFDVDHHLSLFHYRYITFLCIIVKLLC